MSHRLFPELEAEKAVVALCDSLATKLGPCTAGLEMMSNDPRCSQLPQMIADAFKEVHKRAQLITTTIKEAREKMNTKKLEDMGIGKPASLIPLIGEARRVQGLCTGVFAALGSL